jgi:pimeloyl-ACP methyl ester carboxylesterase
MPTMYLAHDFQRELERSFVVVQWDRRGAGKSFTAEMSSQQMSVSQEISDTLELIDQLCARFQQPKVYLIGFSYGSYLGILIAQRAPERLHAYVGIGQLACWEQENRTIQDTWIREQATRVHDNEPIDELDGKKPLDREKWLFKYGGEIHSAHTWWPLLWSGLRSTEYTFQDTINVNEASTLLRATCDTMSSTARSLKTYRPSRFRCTFSAADLITQIRRLAQCGCSRTSARR